jgi:hypothetical protein
MSDANKLLQTADGELLFKCIGCGNYHGFRVKGEGHPIWQWNGDLVNPTFSPSLLVNGSDPNRRCHLYVEQGKIRYLEDCWHRLKGQTVPMETND